MLVPGKPTDFRSGNSSLDAARERRKQRVMSLMAAGFPVPNGRLFELVGRLSDPVVDLSGVSQLIRSEQRLKGQILSLLSSSRLEEHRQPLGIEDAVVLLGAERLRILAVSCALADFAARRLPAECMRDFWQHSILTALLSARIALEAEPDSVEKAHLGGLLHDIGRLPLLIIAHEEQAENVKHLRGADEQIAFEESYFGVNHCEVGRWIAISANFAYWMTEIIAHHHNPGAANEDPTLTAIVAAAERHSQIPAQLRPWSITEADADDVTTECGELLARTRPAGLMEHGRAAQSQFLESSDLHSVFPRFSFC